MRAAPPKKPGAGSSRNLPYRQNCLRWIARSLWMKPRRRCPMAAVCWCGGAAFPQGLPPLQTESDFWLVPLLAQYNGYASATFETAAQCAARADVLDAALAAQRGVGPVFRLMGRTVKNALRKRKESAR